MNHARLMAVAASLRQSAVPAAFDMGRTVHGDINDCGRIRPEFAGCPADILAHYATRRDQSLLRLDPARPALLLAGEGEFSIDDPRICEHFGIESSDARRLFGCSASSAQEAADLVEAFCREATR